MLDRERFVAVREYLVQDPVKIKNPHVQPVLCPQFVLNLCALLVTDVLFADEEPLTVAASGFSSLRYVWEDLVPPLLFRAESKPPSFRRCQIGRASCRERV